MAGRAEKPDGAHETAAFPGRLLIFVSRQTERLTCDVIRPDEIVSRRSSQRREAEWGHGECRPTEFYTINCNNTIGGSNTNRIYLKFFAFENVG